MERAKVAYNNRPDCLTIPEIIRLGSDAGALARLFKENHEAWSEAICYLDNVDGYRDRRDKRERDLRPQKRARRYMERLHRRGANAGHCDNDCRRHHGKIRQDTYSQHHGPIRERFKELEELI